jgi:ABC-2 type transport system permease protein
MRLLRSEFLRARSRRLVPMVLLGGMVAAIVAMSFAAYFSDPASDDSVATAEAQAERNLQRCLDGRFTQAGQVPPGYDSLEDYCRSTELVSLSDAGVWLHDLPVVLVGIGTFVILLAAWLGASLAGADWSSNTMTTLLTWEPRRTRVLVTRAVVVAVVVGVVIVFLQGFFSALFALVAKVFGTTALSPPDLWSDVAATIGRISLMGLAIALVAYAVAMIGRSTVASLGALFGYLVLFEGVIAGFRPQIQSYLLVRAAGVIVSQQPILDYSATSSSGSGGSYSYATPDLLLDVSGAWVVVAAYVLGLLALTLVAFHRRDVT